MASYTGDALGEASASASQTENHETYHDLLGEVQIEENDPSMVDFQGGPSQSFHMPPVAVMVTPQASKVPAIKMEALEGPFISETTANTLNDPIEISDTEDPDSIFEHAAEEDLEEITILDAESTSVPIKKENDEVEFLWEKMGDRVIELDSDDEPNTASQPNLGRSFLKGLDPTGKRRSIDSAAMRRAQEAHLQVLRRRHGIPEPSATRGIVPGLGLQGPKPSDIPVDDNSSDWMNDVYTPEEDTSRSFRTLRKSYKAKVKRDSNTVLDDIEFAKAEKAENLRLARLKAEYDAACGYSDEEDSDDGLFVSPLPAETSRVKRRAADDPDVEDENSESPSRKQRKPNSKRKGAQQPLDQEQEINMMAGIEEALRKINEEEAKKLGQKGKGKSSRKTKAGKDGSKRTKRKPHRAGYLNNTSSLLTSNVYEDADANLDREALPVSGHTNKQKALAALVASVPLGTTPEDAIAQKNRILKSTVILGRNIKGSCKADGDDNWKLAGMKSSLRHHQALAAAFCKERETGGEEPLGGILADAMGLGKTVTTIALMIANPPPRGEKHRATLIVCTPALLVQCKFLIAIAMAVDPFLT